MKTPLTFDGRRQIIIPGKREETLNYAVEKWIEIGRESIEDHGFFAVALSGGSTPKSIFQALVELPKALDWSKVYLFWGDERSVAPQDPESNYHMAMQEAGLSRLPIPESQIFRMVAEEDIEANAKRYEELLRKQLAGRPLDLVMLGMGDDGHTASLFPHTKGLQAPAGKFVIANEVPQKNTWRMSLTFEYINSARHISLYVMGASKAEILEKVLTTSFDPKTYPSQMIGSQTSPALWIIDHDASQNLLAHLK